jgi:hypothetical protein
LILGTRLFFSYRKSERKQTLYLSLLLILGGLALLSLTIEQLVLRIYVEEGVTGMAERMTIFEFSEIDEFFVGFLFAALAWITSSIAIISANFFTQSFFPESNRKLLLIPILLMAAYLVIIITAPFQFISTGSDWTPEHDAVTNVVVAILFLVPLWTVSVLFLYLSVSLKRKNMSAWRRTGWFFMSQAILSIGFTIEILNPSAFINFFTDIGLTFEILMNETLWSLTSRFMIMIYAILMWIAVYTPNWAKGLLGASRS